MYTLFRKFRDKIYTALCIRDLYSFPFNTSRKTFAIKETFAALVFSRPHSQNYVSLCYMLYKQEHKDTTSFFQPCTDTTRRIIQFPGHWQKTVTCRWRRTGKLPRGSHYVHRIHDSRLLRERFAKKIRSGHTNGSFESEGVLCVLFLRPDCSSFREMLFLRGTDAEESRVILFCGWYWLYYV